MDLSQAFPHTATLAAQGQRLDQYLAEVFPQLSRSRWARLIDQGYFQESTRPLGTASRLREGIVIECLRPEALRVAIAPQIENTVNATETVVFRGEAPELLFEDDDLLVINKPVGLTVHPGAGVSLPDTLVGWCLAQGKLKSLNTAHNADSPASSSAGVEKGGLARWGDEVLEQSRPGIVHRLDRGTSGVMVVAKDPVTHEHLARQFSERRAGRRYFAVVEGRVSTLLQRRPRRVEDLLLRKPCPMALRLSDKTASSFVAFLERDPAQRTRFRVSTGAGKRALTHFVETAYNERLSLVELKLGTGRTHQIRVHLTTLGFPVLGDELYGGKAFRRVMLHAHMLSFTHPRTGERMEISAPWPAADAAWLRAETLNPVTQSAVWASFDRAERAQPSASGAIDAGAADDGADADADLDLDAELDPNIDEG